MLLKNGIRYLKNVNNKWRQRGRNVRFLPGSTIDNKCLFEGNNSIGVNTTLYACELGTGSYVGRNVEFSSVKIGRFCSIGSFIRNTGGRHPLEKFVSTHPAFFSRGKAAGFTFSTDQKFEELKYADNRNLVVIGNDVWIGDNVTILDGVTIGDGAVIGANSLVTKNIAPYTINIGLPARPVKSRFNEDIVKFLLEFRWWDRDLSWIRENQELFSDIEKFMQRTKKG